DADLLTSCFHRRKWRTRTGEVLQLPMAVMLSSRSLLKVERGFECHEHRHGLTHSGTGREARLPECLDGFLVEAVDRVERSDNLHVADGAVGSNDTLEYDAPLNSCFDCRRGVPRPDLAD